MVNHNRYRQKKHFKGLNKKIAATHKAAIHLLKPNDSILRPVKVHTELYRQPAEGYRQYTYGASNPALRPEVPKGEKQW